MATFWFKALQCIGDVSKVLHHPNISIADEVDLTDLAFSDAENLLEWMKSFEHIFMATFWFKALQCIDDVSKVLQHAS